METTSGLRARLSTNQRTRLSPRPFREKGGDVPREIFGSERHSLAFCTGKIRGDAKRRVPKHLAIQEHASTRPFLSGHMRFQAQPIIAWGHDVGRLKRKVRPIIFHNGSRQNDVAILLRVQSIRPVLLELLAQRGSHRIANSRLQNFAREWVDLDGPRSRDLP
jgi:hypothetical protein